MYTKKMISIKRVYDEPTKEDGYRILVDRLWPRGISKEKAAISLWLKDIAPSDELRQWFGHRPELFKEFKARYQTELTHNPALEELKKITAAHTKITLLYAAHDPKYNQAFVLQGYLQR